MCHSGGFVCRTKERSLCKTFKISDKKLRRSRRSLTYSTNCMPKKKKKNFVIISIRSEKPLFVFLFSFIIKKSYEAKGLVD